MALSACLCHETHALETLILLSPIHTSGLSVLALVGRPGRNSGKLKGAAEWWGTLCCWVVGNPVPQWLPDCILGAGMAFPGFPPSVSSPSEAWDGVCCGNGFHFCILCLQGLVFSPQLSCFVYCGWRTVPVTCCVPCIYLHMFLMCVTNSDIYCLIVTLYPLTSGLEGKRSWKEPLFRVPPSRHRD